jgi:hypothetical protein
LLHCQAYHLASPPHTHSLPPPPPPLSVAWNRTGHPIRKSGGGVDVTPVWPDGAPKERVSVGESVGERGLVGGRNLLDLHTSLTTSMQRGCCAHPPLRDASDRAHKVPRQHRQI